MVRTRRMAQQPALFPEENTPGIGQEKPERDKQDSSVPVTGNEERCPLCDEPYDESFNSKHKKFREACGHVKCYLCLIASLEEGCTDCIGEAAKAASSSKESSPDKKANSNGTSSPSNGDGGNDKKNEDDNHVAVYPDAFRESGIDFEAVAERAFPKLNYIGLRKTCDYVPTYGKSFRPVVGLDSPVDDGRMPSTSRGFAASTVTSSGKGRESQVKTRKMKVETVTKADSDKDDSSDQDAEDENSEPEKEKPAERKDDLDHITILEQNPPLFQCNICLKKFRTRCQIYYHKYCKGGDKPYKCDECGKGFITSGHYKGHLRTHTGERPFRCPVCDRAFTDPSVMRRHARSHTGEKQHHCKLCASSFTTAQALKEHALTHSGERPFDCPHCNKSFHRRKILQKHILTHTGERPFTCEECGKTFAQKWTYDLHVKTHSTELPFSCAECSKKFGTKRNLRRHMFLHSNLRRYTCEFCGAGFKRKDNLDRHLRYVHEGNEGAISGGILRPNETGSFSEDEIDNFPGNAKSNEEGSKREKLAFPRMVEALLPTDPQHILELISRKCISDRIRHAAIRKAVVLEVDLLASDQNGNTFVHRLVDVLTPEQFHDIVELLIELNLGDIFSVKNSLGQTAIHLALERMQVLLSTLHLISVSCQFNWNAGDLRGNTVLHIAIQTGNLAAVEFFISLGVDVNVRDLDENTPLHRARFAQQNFGEIIARLEKNGADVNAVDANGNNMVHMAVVDGMTVAELELLVNIGVDWRAKNQSDHSVLHLGTLAGHVEAMKYFISLGADVNALDHDQRTPFHWATFSSQNFPEMIQLLVEKGAYINAVDTGGNNGILLATYFGRSREELEQLVNLGCNFTAINGKGQSVLHLAAESGNVEALEYFISTGADVNYKSLNGEAPLHRVQITKHNFVETLKILKESGADMNAVDEQGNNLVHAAILLKRSKKDLECILQVGCDWRMKTKCGYSVLHLATQIGHSEAVQYFISLGAEINTKDDFEMTPIIQLAFAKEGFCECLRLLVENGAEVNAKDKDGRNLLFVAALSGKLKEELEEIVSFGGDWKESTMDGGLSLLHILTEVGNPEGIKYFISLGADPNCKNSFDETPFHRIRFNKQNFVETVTALVSSGAEVNAVDKNGNNPLMIATAAGRTVEELKQLVELGGNWNAKNNFGQTVLDAALEGGNSEALDYFTSMGTKH